MAAGLGFKTFTTGEVLSATDVNGYLMQGVLVFASTAARDAAITSPQEGQFAFTKDTDQLWYRSASAWVASGATGDIEGVTAGTGITGGGTSGTVTITNDMATTITAAGDIVVGTGSGTYDNLPIGTTAQVLTADTTVSPYKVKWATPASGSTFVGCYIYDTNAQNCVAGTRTILTADSELYDTDGFHSTSSNTSRITIPAGKAGKYLLSGAGFFSYFSGTASCTQKLAIMKNGSLFFTFPSFAEPIAGGSSAGQIASIVVDAIVTDYFELAAQQASANTQPFQLISGSGFFSASYLGA